MAERMTAAEARDYLRRGGPVDGSLVLARAADALEQYEREAAARAGMPGLRYPWGLMVESGAVTLEWTDSAKALESLIARNANPHWPRYTRAVRLAVVEVVEPEPPRPVREVGPSGFAYQRNRQGSVSQYDGEWCRWVGVDPNAVSVPPADRALVARLLGEVG